MRYPKKRKKQKEEPERPFDPDLITSDEIHKLKAFQEVFSKGHQDNIRYTVHCAFGIVLDLKGDQAAYRLLREHPFFEDMRQPPQEFEVAKWALFYVFGAKRGKKRYRVGRYAAVIERYLREGVEIEEFEAKLREEGGINKAYLLNTKKADQDQDFQDQQQDEDEKDRDDSDVDDQDQQDQDGNQNQEDDESGSIGSSQGHDKTAKVRRSGPKTSKSRQIRASLELNSDGLEAEALQPGPAIYYVIVESKPRLADRDWMEIRLLGVKHRGD